MLDDLQLLAHLNLDTRRDYGKNPMRYAIADHERAGKRLGVENAEMKMRRYQVHDQIEIVAPIERVYAVAVDPQSVPSYVPEVARIELVKKLDERSALVRSYLRVGRMTFAHLYRYRYRPPTHYSGVQENGRLLRGYFSLAFQSRGDRTVVSHAEGILSPLPFLAAVVGFIYFRVLSSGSARKELGRLKSLVESGITQQDVLSNTTHPITQRSRHIQRP